MYVNNTLVWFAVAGLCPEVKVVDLCAVVDRYVKEAIALIIGVH